MDAHLAFNLALAASHGLSPGSCPMRCGASCRTGRRPGRCRNSSTRRSFPRRSSPSPAPRARCWASATSSSACSCRFSTRSGAETCRRCRTSRRWSGESTAAAGGQALPVEARQEGEAPRGGRGRGRRQGDGDRRLRHQSRAHRRHHRKGLLEQVSKIVTNGLRFSDAGYRELDKLFELTIETCASPRPSS